MPVSASRKLRIQRKKEKKKEKETNQQNKEKRWVRRTTEIKSKNNNSDKFCLRLAGAGLCSTHTTQNSPCHCHRLLSAILLCHNTKQSMSLSHTAILSHHNTKQSKSLSHTAILSHHNTKQSMSLSQAAKCYPVSSQHKTVHVTVTGC